MQHQTRFCLSYKGVSDKENLFVWTKEAFKEKSVKSNRIRNVIFDHQNPIDMKEILMTKVCPCDVKEIIVGPANDRPGV